MIISSTDSELGLNIIVEKAVSKDDLGGAIAAEIRAKGNNYVAYTVSLKDSSGDFHLDGWPSRIIELFNVDNCTLSITASELSSIHIKDSLVEKISGIPVIAIEDCLVKKHAILDKNVELYVSVTPALSSLLWLGYKANDATINLQDAKVKAKFSSKEGLFRAKLRLMSNGLKKHARLR